MSEYNLTRSMIDRFLPEPIVRSNPYYKSSAPMRLWKEEDVLRVLSENKELARVLKEKAKKKEARRKRAMEKSAEAIEFLKQFSPDDLIAQGREMKRHFVLHVGPTNSGKTYDAIQALKKAETGLYLGPLRLLALEMFENLNMDSCPCNLLTGEEFEPIPMARHTASTIELCDFDRHYDVVVIDEAQLIADPFRGAGWTNAICLVNADEVHVCLAPEAKNLIENLLIAMNTEYDIVEHERLVPLEFSGVFKDINGVKPGDALIAFSRKRVLAISAVLEKRGIKSSVIYGALPPAARREETRKFAEKETRVVVATDAIGMGISLPIKRVIFVQTDKFDGQQQRPLTVSEIKQVAGRAGRFGKYDLGEVLTMDNKHLISSALKDDVPSIEKLQIAFPKEALEYDYPLGKLLSQWDNLEKSEFYSREDMTEAEYLLEKLGNHAKGVSHDVLYNLITCPVDIKNDMLVNYWLECCINILKGEDLRQPNFGEYNLELCELKYQAYDVYHQLLRRIGIEDDCLEDKERLCNKINKFLLKKKRDYLRHCRICGRELPISCAYNLCDECHEKNKYRYWD